MEDTGAYRPEEAPNCPTMARFNSGQKKDLKLFYGFSRSPVQSPCNQASFDCGGIFCMRDRAQHT